MKRGLQKPITIRINGEECEVQDISPCQTLLEYLRQNGYIGTKEGCGDGDCGACSVVMITEKNNTEFQYITINSCLIPLGSVAGKEIITVEGVSKEGTHPVQEAMIKTGGSQCGYCTPGFIMSMFAAYYQGKVDDVAIEGNLCRCTGYLPIRRAAQSLLNGQPEEDNFTSYLKQKKLEKESFNYQTTTEEFYRPQTQKELLKLLEEKPEATLVAGATDLGLEFSNNQKKYPVLISLEEVAELKTIKETIKSIEIGAAVTLSQIEEQLKGIFPSLDEMLKWFAARQIRNRATMGGSIGTASPIGDLAPVLLSLDAEVKLISLTQERTIPLVNFFQGYRKTALEAGEVILSIIISKQATIQATNRLSQSYKVGKRGTDDITIVSAAFTIDLDKQQQILQARLAYGGVAAIPIRAVKVEEMLLGMPWNIATVKKAKELLKESFTPLSDLRASAQYRKLLIGNLWEKFYVDTIN